MVQRNLFEICHGCGGALYPGYEHWLVSLGEGTAKVHFHNDCYKHYKRNNAYRIKWARQNEKAK